MLARVLVVVALLALAIWIVAYASGQAELRRERFAPWPYGLGSVDDLAKRPRPKATPEGERILKLLQTLPYPRAESWIGEQVKKGNDAIDPAPAVVEIQPAKTAEIVRLVIASEGRIVWSDQWTVRIRVSGAVDTLAVVALDHARAGDSAAAWDDVHAMWILASSLAGQSFAYSRVLAQELERMTNAVARKLPPPAPPWVEEMTGRDPRPEAAAALQAQSAFAEGSRRRPNRVLAAALAALFRPMIDRFSARTIRCERAVAKAMTARRCHVDDAVNAVKLTGVLPEQIATRAARMDAEAEATAKLLALKSDRARLGRWPPPSSAIAGSRCAGNVWQYQTDGATMSLRMSVDPSWEPSPKYVPQLAFRY
ncbi:MAG TPA: hypothetical protein VG323_21955 [Thermoanaerobaculia bacterium]|nr:hypothetical protein [Thermoanaerobaculia bacterium]